MEDIKLKITEIFHSIQGESTLTGERTSFIRLTGCPLRCTWCDTTYSFTGGKWMSIEEILIEVKSHHTKYVCVTGGEPLSQKKCFELVKELSKNKFNVSIETSGEVLIEGYSEFAKIIMDIKTPSSGEKANICFDNLKFLTEKDEIKLVIQDRTDYEFAKKILNEYKLDQKHLILFSPVYGKINLKELAEWIIKDHLNVRMQTQLHKVIWGENTLGV